MTNNNDRITANRFLNAVTILATVLAIVVLGWRLTSTQSARPALPETEAIRDWHVYAQGGLRVGVHGTPVTVVEFLDFYCSVCERAAAYVAQLPSRYRDDVAIVYRHYPFLTAGSVEAAMAATCAYEEGLLQSFVEHVYDNLPIVGSEAWTELFSRLSEDPESGFESCMSSDRAAAAVMRDTVLANRLGVDGTPTFLINDQKIMGFHGAEAMDYLIEAAILRARRSDTDQ